MSHQAVTWAMDHAPMLLTDKGKPDTTARHVLQVLAERADADGRNAYPSALDVQYRAGYDERTVRRALRRLEQGGLIAADGTKYGCTNWTLVLRLKRPASDLASLKAEREAVKERDAARKQASRKKGTDPVSGTQDPGHGADVRDAESRMSGTQNPAVRDGTPPEPSGTTLEPTWGAPPLDPRRTDSPQAACQTDLELTPDRSKTTPTQLDRESPVPGAAREVAVSPAAVEEEIVDPFAHVGTGALRSMGTPEALAELDRRLAGGVRGAAGGAEQWQHVDLGTLRQLGTPEAVAELERRAAYRPRPTWQQHRATTARKDPGKRAEIRAEMDAIAAVRAEEEAIRRRAEIHSVGTGGDTLATKPSKPYEGTG